MRIRTTLAASLAAIVGITAVATLPASAASNPQPAIHAAAKAGTTDLSARRRHYRHRGNAAVVGAVTGLFGTIASIAAANAWRDAHPYGYYRPYYGPGPYAYAPYPYYGPRW